MVRRKPATDRKRGQPSPKGRQASRKRSLAKWFGFWEGPHPTWIEFARDYPRHPALEADTIYAIPAPLIDAIQLEMPDFFSEQENQFERDLTRAAGGGFFLRRPFGYPPIEGSTRDESTSENARKQLERMKKSAERIKQILGVDVEQPRGSPAQVQEHCATKKRTDEKIDARKWGYAGWLVANPDFRRECSDFRSCWEPCIRKLGGFPIYPTTFLGHSSVVPGWIGEFYSGYTQFYRRWCIHTFATWDLPIPMLAGIASPIFYRLVDVGDAGMALFIPWYLLRDQTFKLQDLAEYERFEKGPDHLQGWFRRNQNRWGHDRLGMMLKVYLIVELCLRARYPHRINRRTEKLDYCLSRLFFQRTDSKDAPIQEVETVRKIRQEMHKRLKLCEISKAES